MLVRGKRLGKWLLARSKMRWENNIKMDVKEMRYEYEGWM
jgi:hypothetical protein